MRDGVCGSAGVWVEGLEGRQLMSVGMVQTGRVVRMDTTIGRITVELTPDVTPLTVANFLNNYVGKKLYDNTLVHRSVPGFVIQGGGYRSTGTFQHIPEADPVVNEFASDKAAAAGGEVNVRGTIAMALRGDDPNSGTSEWFINLADNAHFNVGGGVPDYGLDTQSGGFAVFGNVIGGGMHTVDAIAGLQTVNASGLNPAFTDLPAVTSKSGPVPIVVRSVRAVDELGVRLDGQTKKVMWVDGQGASATITLSKGTADLKFIGSGIRVTQGAGGVVTVTGTAVELVDVATHGTNGSSVLAITSRGGKTSAYVGDITVDGALGRIDAGTVRLDGDLNAAKSVGRIDFGQVIGSTITVGGSGAMVLRVGTATDASVNTTMSLKEMTVGKWVDDGLLPTSVHAVGIGKLTVTGNFSSNVISTGPVGSVVVNGNVGSLGASTWNVTGKVGEVRARAVKDLTLNAGSVDKFTATGAITTSNIRASGSLGSVTAASMKGSTVLAGGSYGSGGFTNAKASVGKVTLTGKGATYSVSLIQGPTIGSLSLGTVATPNGGHWFGIVTKNGVNRLDAVFGKVAVSMSKVKSGADAAAYFAAKKIEPADFDVMFVS